MLLYEEGRFQLDDPASKFIPSWKNLKVFAGGTPEKYETRDPSREVTVRDLLMHTGGAPGLYGISPDMDALMNPAQHIYRNGGVSTLSAPPETLATMAEKMAKLPLHVDPGTRWIYGFATDMVGYLVELISGQPLDRFLGERILQPLGMVDTAFSVPQSKLDRFSACYRLGKPGEPAYVHADSPATSPFARQPTFFSGVAGLLSTASDYMRFAKMLANGGELDGRRIVGARTIELMAINHLPGGVELHEVAMGPNLVAKGTGFGLGFGVLLDPAANQTLGTPGEYYWGGAASTAFFVSPVDDLVAIFMTQLLLGQPHQFSRYLRVLTYQALLD
jgi:CubicO group peptidase (beta-lactamase class C family)